MIVFQIYFGLYSEHVHVSVGLVIAGDSAFPRSLFIVLSRDF